MNFRALQLRTLIVLGLLHLPVYADTAPAAAAAVRELESHYQHSKTLQAVFLERYSDGPQNVHLESGKVYFSRPGRMRWEYESPEKKLFLADGKTVWFYIPADRTATRAPLKQSADWRTPLALLTGKAKLPQLCDHIDVASVPPGTPGNVVLSCLPRGSLHAAGLRAGEKQAGLALADPNQAFDRVFLELNPVTGTLAQVRVIQPGGVELQYSFGNWQENIPLPESLFHFAPPAGVAIVNQADVANP